MLSKLAAFLKLFLVFTISLVTAVSIASAQDDDEDGGDGARLGDLSNILDFKTLGGMDARLAPHGNDLMGDMIDKNSGGISFQHTDVSIPGNSNLEVALRRKKGQGSVATTPFQHGFGEWTIDLPLAYITYGVNTDTGQSDPIFNDGCFGGSRGGFIRIGRAHTGLTTVWPEVHESGVVLHVPGKGLSGRPSNQGKISDPSSDWTSGPQTVDHAGRCASVTIAPDGTKYKFGRHAVRRAADLPVPYEYDKVQNGGRLSAESAEFQLQRRYAVYLITEVEDVNGNWVRYDYTNDDRRELTKISSNDGRVIDIYYQNNSVPASWIRNSRRISHVIANGRRWDYTYKINNSYGTLSKVSLPDGRYWEFGNNGDGLFNIQYEPHPYYKCVPYDKSFQLKHPDGAVGTFRIRETRHIKGATSLGNSSGDSIAHYMKPMDIPHATNNTECNGTRSSSGQLLEKTWERRDGWPIYQAMSIASKTISSPNIPTATWDFEYRNYSGGILDNNWTKITNPDGTITTYTYQAVGNNHGQLMKMETEANGSIVEKIDYEYNQIGVAAPGTDFGECTADSLYEDNVAGNCQVYKKRPLTKMVQERDGDTYTTEYEYDFDVASSPISVTRYTDVAQSTVPRVTTTTYEDKIANWILDLPKTVSRNGREETRVNYNNLGHLISYEKYGQKVYDYTYHSDGTLASITDAIGRKAEALDWHLGTPQRVKRAVGTDDEIETLQTVDDNGWVISQTDARGNTTTISRDFMGRMTEIIPPSGWNSTVIDYDFSVDGAIQTITKGEGVTTVTYDAMFRPILERTQALDTGWSSYVNTEYDGSGRVIFKSQPSTNPNETKGVDMTYDGLGRIYQERENVAPYARTRHRYYSGHRYRVIDPSGAFTQYYRHGYDGPENTDYRAIYRYADGGWKQYTYLYKNVWGQMTRLRQWGNHDGQSVDQNQYFYYDDQQRLCRHYVPEHGATKYEYDAAGQMLAYAKGQANSGCGTVPNVNDKVSMTYDDLGRLTKTDFTDNATPDITRSYDANGNVVTLNRGTGTTAVNWTYTYNSLNLPTTEKLALDDRNYNIDYGYDANGSLRRKRLPSSRNMFYSPDGLGRATKVERRSSAFNQLYAENVTYHPSGSVHQMTYGNGQYFSQILNDRLLPQRLLSYKGTTKAVDQTFSYDARGLVTSIIDGAVSGNDRSYSYDGLGYLKTASGPWGTGSYKYDSVGNIREKKLGGRTVRFTYDNRNRLTQSLDTGESGHRVLGYDTRGNVTSLGNLSFLYDKSDQPVTVSGTANGIGAANGNYRYDGNLKRVKSVINGKTIYNIYDLSGQLVHIHKLSENVKMDYIHGPNGTLARVAANNKPTYLHPDHLGSAQAGTTISGFIAWREQYTPFGEQLQSPADNDNLDGFTGHIKDKDTGLNYMQARYYDPVIGRFLSVDPVGFLDTGNPGMFNRYAYTYNNPINLTDPTGMCPECSGIGSILRVQAFANSGMSPNEAAALNLKFQQIESAGTLVGAGLVVGAIAAPIAGSLGLGTTGTTLATGAIQSGSIGMSQSIANDVINNDGEVNMADVAIDTGFNAVGGLVGKALMSNAFGSMLSDTPVGEPNSPVTIGGQAFANMNGGAALGLGTAAVTGGDVNSQVKSTIFGAIGSVHPAAQLGAGAAATYLEHKESN